MKKLKWLLNLLLVMAFMLLGLKLTPKKDKPDNKDKKSAIIWLLIR